QTGTGWIGADDGLLLLDQNGNGTIDNGTEVCGDRTATDSRTAETGFEALAALDSNADGVIDANDVQFADLQVWQDSNQDGISQANELHSLTDVGIESISLTHSDVSENQGNGNTIIETGTFNFTDGTQGDVASLALASNPFNSNFTQSVFEGLEIPEALQSLPDMSGSGAVRDLIEAASLNANLVTVLQSYSAADTREAQMALIDEMLTEWAETSEFDDWLERLSNATINGKPVVFRVSEMEPVSTGGDNGEEGIGIDPEAAEELQARLKLLDRIKILEAFNGQAFFNFDFESESADNSGMTDLHFGVGSIHHIVSIDASITITPKDLAPTQPQADLLNQAYDALVISVYQSLLLQTRFDKHLDAIGLAVVDGEIALDFSGLETVFDQDILDNPIQGLDNLLEFAEHTSNGIRWESYEYIGNKIRAATVDSDIQALLDEYGIEVLAEGSLQYTMSEAGTGIGNDLDNQINGSVENDRIFGDDGADVISGGEGDDLLSGGAGNDELIGGAGVDSLHGGAGNDVLSAGDGVQYNNSTGQYVYGNIFEGGVGDDTINGSIYGDSYYFNVGDGQDVINDDGTHANQEGFLDTIYFGPGISQNDISLVRDGLNLIFVHGNGNDQIIVNNWFETSAAYHHIEQVNFADGASWDFEQLTAMALITTEGADLLNGSIADDVIDGLGGDDVLHGKDGDDIINGGDGNDTLQGDNGSDILRGDAGDDLLSGKDGNDTLEGGDGRDRIYGGAGNDILRGGTGIDDHLLGEAGNDTYEYRIGDGNTTISNYAPDFGSQDVLKLLGGILAADVVATRSLDSLVLTIQSSGEVITVTGYFVGHTHELDAIEFDDGTIWDVALIKTMVLTTTEGDDEVRGYNADDVINGFGGNDELYGAEGADTIDGGAGDDDVYGDEGVDNLNGSDGNDQVYGGDGNDVVIGGAGDDSVYGQAGDDVIEGGDGRDRVYGGSGNDILRGGIGEGDYLSGDAGNDTYLFETGDGNTTIYNYDAEAGHSDVLQFLDGVAPADVTATRISDNLLLTLSSTGEVIAVTNYFNSSNYELNAIEFSDGTVWDTAVVNGLVLGATDGADNITGSDGDDTLDSLGGNDYLYGGNGNDTLSGGEGSDRIYGQNGNDTVRGGTGNDYLYGYAGDDVLEGGDDRDYLYGGTGNDTLSGGTGTNDYLSGDTGDDTYLFAVGDGSTTIYNYDAGSDRNDVLRFLDGITPADVVATRSSIRLLLTVQSTGEVITVNNFFSGTNYELNAVEFTDGTIWDTNMLKTLVLGATEGADNITGYSSDDTIDAMGGNDYLYGADGNDTLSGGGGADRVYGQNGNDTIDGGADNDYVYGDAGDDILNGGDGRDNIYGGTGNDTLSGGTGAGDYLSGDTGDDTYLFAIGDGNTTIRNYDTGTGRQDTLQFLDGIIPSDVATSRSGTSLLLTIQSTGEVITVNSFFGSSSYELNTIEFSDGTSWDPDHIKALVIETTEGADNVTGYDTDDTLNGLGGSDYLYGADGNDTLSGGDGNDRVYGQNGNDTVKGDAGNDYLYGNAGDDILEGGDGTDRVYGGAGNDTLRGGSGDGDYLSGESGNDTYLYSTGDGSTTIFNYDASAIDDKLVFDTGVSIDDIWFSQAGNNLIVTLAVSDDQITINGWFGNDYYQLDSIEAGSSVLLNNQVDQLVSAMAAYSVPSGAGNVIPQDVKDALQPVLADTWQAA
ncbi:MAG: calcium-binding protein, partial [Gammaproteobacteria bacterium]|nr:calcium-binding protein [Gammaproteobacteria bacterium]